jgi:hypothetical protein
VGGRGEKSTSVGVTGRFRPVADMLETLLLTHLTVPPYIFGRARETTTIYRVNLSDLSASLGPQMNFWKADSSFGISLGWSHTAFRVGVRFGALIHAV